MRQILISALFLTVFGCSDTGNQQNQITEGVTPDASPVPAQHDTLTRKTNSYSIYSNAELKDYIVADISGNNFTLVTERSGIFISPDTEEIEHMKKEYGEDFYTAADDNLYYEYEADKLLEEKNIKTVYPKTRYLKFKTNTGQEYFFDTKTEDSPNWYLILFDPSKDRPEIISAIDIAEEYSSYFSQK